MRSTRLVCISLFSIATALSATTAYADEAAAAELFSSGAAAYAKSDFRTAAALFQRAYKEAPRGAAIFNAGLAWEAAGEGPRAADAFTTALSADLDSSQTATARTRLKALNKSLGIVDVKGAAARVSVAHVDANAPVSFHLPPGKHDVVVTFANDKPEHHPITVTAGETIPLTLVAPPPPPTPTPTPAPTPLAPAPAFKTEQTSDWLTNRKILGFALVGGGVLASGAAVFLGLSALSSRDDYDASGHRDQDARDSAASLRTWTNVSWIAAGVLAAGGVVLIVTDTPSKSTTSAGLGPRGAFVSVRF